jgi:hypothetical protein
VSSVPCIIDLVCAGHGCERLLGNVHPESYVYVQDVRATAYGFGGRTQEYRHQHPNP